MNSNDVMKSFLLKGDEEVGPNKVSYSEAAINLQELCRGLVNNTLDGKITLTTGIGLNNVGVPLRCPALIIPALKIIRNLMNQGITDIEYCIYQASSFIIKENSLDELSAKINSSIIIKYLKWYIGEFYGDIADKISFNFDFDLDEKRLEDISGKIEQIEGDEDVDLMIGKLVKYAESKGKPKSSALMYGSANIVCNGQVSDYYPISSDVDNILIPIGGRKEKPFFNLGRAYNQRHNSSNDNSNSNRNIVIPILQRTGDLPAYYPYVGEDYINSNHDYVPLSGDKLHGSVKFDRDLVLSELGTGINFNNLIQQILG